MSEPLHAMFSAVYRQANNINMLKDGMKIEATHVKKKQLHQYLPPELVQKKKRVRCLPLQSLNRFNNHSYRLNIRPLCLLSVNSPLFFFFGAEHS